LFHEAGLYTGSRRRTACARWRSAPRVNPGSNWCGLRSSRLLAEPAGGSGPKRAFGCCGYIKRAKTHSAFSRPVVGQCHVIRMVPGLDKRGNGRWKAHRAVSAMKNDNASPPSSRQSHSANALSLRIALAATPVRCDNSALTGSDFDAFVVIQSRRETGAFRSEARAPAWLLLPPRSRGDFAIIIRKPPLPAPEMPHTVHNEGALCAEGPLWFHWLPVPHRRFCQLPGDVHVTPEGRRVFARHGRPRIYARPGAPSASAALMVRSRFKYPPTICCRMFLARAGEAD